MTSPPDDQVRFARPRQLPGLELVQASYRQRIFPVHSHQEFVVGVTIAGAERLDVRGQQLVAGRGDLILLEPDEAHANRTLGEGGVSYAVFYVPAAMAAAFGTVRFPANVVRGGALGRQWARLHRRMMSDSGIEREEDFFGLLGAIFEMAGSRAPALRPAEPGRIARARDFLDSHFAEPVTLTELAAVAGLSPYHLLRTFRDQVGITPGAYQIQLRVLEARRRLRDGALIADTAADLGFADQSHLSRHFQRIIGTSPGRYAQQ
ncbi:MAG: AraC family transcriptional regulator [Sphingomicrobium sp.]